MELSPLRAFSLSTLSASVRLFSSRRPTRFPCLPLRSRPPRILTLRARLVLVPQVYSRRVRQQQHDHDHNDAGGGQEGELVLRLADPGKDLVRQRHVALEWAGGELRQVDRSPDHDQRRRLPDGAREREYGPGEGPGEDRKSTRLNSSHANISYAVFCL